MAKRAPGVVPYKLTDGSDRYRVRLFHEGRRYTWSGFVYKDEAKHYYQDRKRDLREGRPFPTIAEPVPEPPTQRTLSQAIDDYLIGAKLKKGYREELTFAAYWNAQLGDTAIDQITPTDIDQGRKAKLSDGCTGARVNRYVAWLHHVFRLEIESERLVRNPCRVFVRSSVKGGQRFPERPAPDVVFTDEQLVALAKELREDILCPILAMLTGLRRDEQFALRKETLDLERRIGHLHDPKAGTNQVFHLNDDAVRIIEHFMRQSGDSPFLFPSRRWPMQRSMSGQHWYASRFKPAAARAGIEIDRRKGRTWHTLRHSFADRLVNLSVPILDVQEAGRWNSWAAMKRYVKKSNHRVQRAVNQLKSPIELDHFLTTETTSNLKDNLKILK